MYIYIYIRAVLRSSHGLLECSAPVLCLYVCMYACMHARVIHFVYALEARVPRRNSLDTYLVVTYTFLCTRVHTCAHVCRCDVHIYIYTYLHVSRRDIYVAIDTCVHVSNCNVYIIV